MDCGIDGQEMNTHAEINRPFPALPRLKLFCFSFGAAPHKCRVLSARICWATAGCPYVTYVSVCIRWEHSYMQYVHTNTRPWAGLSVLLTAIPAPRGRVAVVLQCGALELQWSPAGCWVSCDLLMQENEVWLLIQWHRQLQTSWYTEPEHPFPAMVCVFM